MKTTRIHGNRKTTAEFIADAIKRHGDFYDYSKSEYVGASKTVEIICPIHGSFWQGASAHTRGSGCSECKSVKLRKVLRKTTEQYIKEAREVHGDRYDYSLVKYKNSKTSVIIICKKHGEFTQRAENHLRGSNCPDCGNEARGAGRKLAEDNIRQQAEETHNFWYDYSETNFSNLRNRVTIICPDHGPFEMVLQYHRDGQGCTTCGLIATANKRRLTVGEFISRATKTHNGKFDYSQVEYKNAREKVAIICPKHGAFEQTPDSHLQGAGCPNCGTMISRGEREVFEFIRDKCCDDVEQQFKIDSKSFDIRAGNMLVEYHGLYWHSNRNRTEVEAKRMHETRRRLANDNGFRYIAIYEDEWRDRRELVESYLLNVFGKSRKAGARQFEVREVTAKRARNFYNRHHLLGAGAARGRHMALTTSTGRIVACMTLGNSAEVRGQTNQVISLSRFCTDGRAIAGAASRLFKAFNPDGEVVSYIDLDKFEGSIYERLGFKYDSYIEPDYMTLWGGSAADMHRRHKTATRRSELAKLEGFDPNLSERENCLNMGIYRIYHSGRVKVVWSPKRFTPVEALF